MDTFFDRIGLGCARFGGGIEESGSRRVIQAALDCGVRYFDTAPSYGGRASERIVGTMLRGMRQQVQLCTKVGLSGSTPTLRAHLRALARRVLRATLPDAALDRLKQGRRPAPAKGESQRGFGRFDLSLVSSSLAQSLDALKTDHVDCLMLHEPNSSDPEPEVAGLLARFVLDGRVRKLGVGTYAYLEDLPPFGDVAQFAIGLEPMRENRRRIRIVHGVLREHAAEVFDRCARMAGVFEELPSLERHLFEPHGSSALLLNAVLFGIDIDRVLVSTTSPKRLSEFLPAAANAYADIQRHGGRELRARFAAAVREYLSHRQSVGDESRQGRAS